MEKKMYKFLFDVFRYRFDIVGYQNEYFGKAEGGKYY